MARSRQAELLPVPYFHVVFTLPGPIAEIAYQNKAVVYDLLLKIAAETLITIAADPKHLGARTLARCNAKIIGVCNMTARHDHRAEKQLHGSQVARFLIYLRRRRDLADTVVSVREPRRLPVVLSPEEVARLLAASPNGAQPAFDFQ